MCVKLLKHLFPPFSSYLLASSHNEIMARSICIIADNTCFSIDFFVINFHKYKQYNTAFWKLTLKSVATSQAGRPRRRQLQMIVIKQTLFAEKNVYGGN